MEYLFWCYIFLIYRFSGVVRLGAGFIGDLKYVKRNALVGACWIYCGLLSLISILLETFEGLVVYSALFAVGAGIFISINKPNCESLRKLPKGE